MKPAPDGIDDGYSYERWSGDSQSDGDSGPRQDRLRAAWLARNPHVRLNTSLRDEAVSGYTGVHRKNLKHALARFIDQVENGLVRPGSYLIVENLDRLTRENPVDSIPAVLDLIRRGIRIVQLAPVEIVYDRDMDQMKLMNMLWELARGHGESRRKGGMLGSAWGEKKQMARETKEPHGKAVPDWLELVDRVTVVRGGKRRSTGGRYVVRPEARRAILAIFRWCAEDLGAGQIVNRLVAEGFLPFGRRTGRWTRAYVTKILHNRAVLGEYQPGIGRTGRVPDGGEPVAGYFPRVVTDAEWHAAHMGMRSRKHKTGRPPRDGVRAHPFAGLVRDALDRCPLHAIRRGDDVKYLASARAAAGEAGTHWRLFPVDVFTTAVLSLLSELKAADLFGDPGAGRVAELNGQLGEIKRRLGAARKRFESDPESPTWADMVTQYDREHRAVLAELKEAERAASQPLSTTWTQAVELMATGDPGRLRAALLLTVREVTCLFVRKGNGDRIAVVQVWFAGEEGVHRDYLIRYRPPRKEGRRRPAGDGFVTVDTLTLGPSELDVRDHDQAESLDAELAGMTLEDLVTDSTRELSHDARLA